MDSVRTRNLVAGHLHSAQVNSGVKQNLRLELSEYDAEGETIEEQATEPILARI